MRHILFAAVCTLCIITAALSLPPAGEPHATLVAQTPGDRAAVETADVERRLVSPSSQDELSGDAENGIPGESGTLALADIQQGATDGVFDPDESLAGLPLPSVIQDALAGSATIPTDEDTTDEDTESADDEAGTDTSDESADVEEVANVAPTTSTTTTTAAPTTTTTAAPTTTTTAAPAAPAPASDGGVIISQSGVVLPVLGAGADGGFRALTPCGNEVTLHSGERVATVDFVLDPGHGGTESGAVGPAGALEKELNTRISEITQWYLEEAGYTVLLTRTTDIRIPLRSRAEIANALDPLAFVSIHHNGGATRRQDTPGTEMFVDGGNPEASRLGGIMFEELTERLSAFEADWVGTWRNGVGTRFNSAGEDLYGIHRFTPGVPSVIAEAGYLSNPSEEALFVDNDVQWAHGRAIAEALIRWDRTDDAGSGYLDDFVDDSSSGTGGFDGCTDPAL